MPDRLLRLRLAAGLVAALLGAAALVVVPRPAAAGFIGDPTFTNGAGRFSVTGDLDIVTDRDIDFDGGGKVDLESTRLFATAGYGFASNVDGFVKLGLFSGEIDNADLDTGLALGFGVKGAFVDRGEIRLGALGQVLYFQSEIDDAAGADVDWLEVDVALAASFRGLGQIVPYAGLDLSLIDGEVEPGNDFEQDDILGLFGGVTFAVSPQVSLGAELRIIGETALGAFARFLF